MCDLDVTVNEDLIEYEFVLLEYLIPKNHRSSSRSCEKRDEFKRFKSELKE